MFINAEIKIECVKNVLIVSNTKINRNQGIKS